MLDKVAAYGVRRTACGVKRRGLGVFLPGLALCVMLFALCIFPLSQAKGGQKMGIRIESPAFKEGGMIPVKYTCDGEDVSPALTWGDLPAGTRSIALISDDPDAPVGTWVHWVLYNLPPDLRALPENVPPDKTLENGAVHGTNDFKRPGYGGPCPPGGTHRYFFKLYALDKKIDLAPGATKAQLTKSMEGHILDSGQLMGKYKR